MIPMTTQRRRELRNLEGRMVHLAMADGSRLDDVPLVSVITDTAWVYLRGEDVVVPLNTLVDFWEGGATARGS